MKNLLISSAGFGLIIVGILNKDNNCEIIGWMLMCTAHICRELKNNQK